jgi:hypothetical protein
MFVTGTPALAGDVRRVETHLRGLGWELESAAER